MPSPWNTASKEPVNWHARSLIRNLIQAALPEVHQDVARRLGRPRAVRIRGEAGEVNAANGMLDQGADALTPQEHLVHMDEIDRQNAAGLCGQVSIHGVP